ncbi:unnamed protein product [Linum tenue]|uniref:Glycosyltransferase n=1 Tax=Linum tenue TaxID=586396 RepID=A0AAV0MFX3_9ROSI|nr:unnamed protein product [Linum tenue]
MALHNKEEEEEPHVLMVAFSAQGHLNPMLRLGKRLISHGLHVTIATTHLQPGRRLFKPSSSSSATGHDIDFLFYSDGLDGRKVDIDTFMDSLSQHGPTNLTKLIHQNYHTAPSDANNSTVSNPFVPWAANVAHDLGIPCAMLWIQPVALYAVYYRYYRNLNPFPTLTDPDLTVNLPGLPPLRTEDLPSFVLPTNTFGAFSKLFSEMFGAMEKHASWVLANSFHALEADVIINSSKDLFPVVPVGPLVDPSLLGKGEEEEADGAVNLWEVDHSCMEWLDEQAAGSVVYVLERALKEGRWPFVWVVKGTEAGELSTSSGGGQGIVVAWAPQTKVLAHRAVGCFVTHGGWNSTLEAVAAGVPMVVYPQWSDQPTNAKLVEDVFGVGVRVRENGDVKMVVGSEEMGRAIREVMDGPKSEQIKGNARRLKIAAGEAVAAGGEGTSKVSVRKFVDEIVGRSCSSSGPCCGEGIS